jgi:hypothetical protein
MQYEYNNDFKSFSGKSTNKPFAYRNGWNLLMSKKYKLPKYPVTR